MHTAKQIVADLLQLLAQLSASFILHNKAEDVSLHSL